MFARIAELKDRLDINVELAAPDQFIPAVPGWRERSAFIAMQGGLSFYHYDFYSKALAKIERWHERDRIDVRAMLEQRLVEPHRLGELFAAIAPELIRFPASAAATFRARVAVVREGPHPMTARAQQELVAGLPGGEFFHAGLHDLQHSIESVAAMLVATGARRIQESLGDLSLPGLPIEPERRLDALLCREHAQDAYSQYNAHLRRLSSFCRALEARTTHGSRGSYRS